MTSVSIRRRPLGAAFGCFLCIQFAFPLPADDEVPPPRPIFNWDLVSLEQNSNRFNASVLSGFHTVRSPGVTPYRGWKTGVGILFSREEQVAVATNTELFNREQILVNPKLNYGFWPGFEVGAGFETVWTKAKDIRGAPSGAIDARSEQRVEPSAVGLGLKWNAFAADRLRLALSFDSRIAVNRGELGTLPATIMNVEVDSDYTITPRWSVISNLQFQFADEQPVEDEAVLDLATAYTFSDQFRGMIFTTGKEDDEASSILYFVGLAGQYVYEQHSFTLALDFQLNDAEREIRTQSQLDLEFSYAFTF